MTLHVHTARLNYPGPDRLDITRRGADDARKRGAPAPGEPFAPSWRILKPALAARYESLKIQRGSADEPSLAESEIDDAVREWAARKAAADAHEAAAWAAYVAAYLDEMRASYRAHRAAWDALLARGRVVLVCFCSDAAHCHRAILRERVLPALGAVNNGEITL